MRRLHRRRPILLLLAATPLFTAGCQTPSPTRPQTADSRFDAVRAEIASKVESDELKSVAVGAIEDGKIVWAEALGFADAEAGRRATLNTPYGIASMGKAVTATAAMTLVEAGKLDLDANVADLLGSEAVRVGAGDRAPTVRELLNMSAGVPHGAITYFAAKDADESKILDHQSFVAFPAGETFHYSNFSMAIMERVIEKASGRRYDDYVADAVFTPLAMKDARIGPNAPFAAARYRSDGTRFEPLWPLPRSSRQISASLDDLLNFAAMNLKAPINGGAAPLAASSIDRLQNEKSGLPGAHIALGIGNFDLGGGKRLVASSGNDMGVQSSMFLLPESGLGAVVLSNSSGYHSDELAMKLLDAMEPGFLDALVPVISAFEARTTPFSPTAEWLGAWRGEIRSQGKAIPVSLTVTEADVRVRINEGAATNVTELAMRDGMVTGAFEGILELYEKPEGPHRIEISLIADSGELTGFALANFRSSRGKFEIPAAMRLIRAD